MLAYLSEQLPTSVLASLLPEFVVFHSLAWFHELFDLSVVPSVRPHCFSWYTQVQKCFLLSARHSKDQAHRYDLKERFQLQIPSSLPFLLDLLC